MKRILKWLIGFTFLLVALVVILLLSLDSILGAVAENRIRAETGMAAKIGKFHIGLTEPVITITDFKLYNPANFGGTPLVEIPEIHVEYDAEALSKNQIHITLARLNLRELVIVKNEAGETNLFSLGIALPSKSSSQSTNPPAIQPLLRFKQQTGLAFTRVDVLNVSVGSARFIDLKNPACNREQKIGIENLVVRDIKSPADLTGLAVLVALRGGDFFVNIFGNGINP